MERQVDPNQNLSLNGLSEDVVKKIQAFIDQEETDSKELYHYGTPRHSGRYPWGSGENPYQGDMDFKAHYNSLKNF